jgi:DNA-directed RNA polymerase specialized sigma24 family protein
MGGRASYCRFRGRHMAAGGSTMAAEDLNPGNNRALREEGVSDLIEEFVQNEYGKVVETVALSTGEDDDAEDAVQVALLRILARGRRPLHLGLHVTVMATDLIYSRRRRARGLLGWAPKLFDLDGNRHGDESASGGGGALRRTVSELSRRQRLVSLLHYYLDCPISEISLVLGVPRLAVAGTLLRARSQLKVLLEDGERR